MKAQIVLKISILFWYTAVPRLFCFEAFKVRVTSEKVGKVRIDNKLQETKAEAGVGPKDYKMAGIPDINRLYDCAQTLSALKGDKAAEV